MPTDVKELAKQTIDELSENEIMELLEFLNDLHKKHEKTGQETHRELRESLDA